MTKSKNNVWKKLYKIFLQDKNTNEFSISKNDIITFLLDKTASSVNERHCMQWAKDPSTKLSFEQKKALIHSDADAWDLDSFLNIHNGMILDGETNHRFINYNQFKLIKNEITEMITTLFDNYIDQINLAPDNDELDYKNYSINQKLQTLVLCSVFGSINPVLFDTRNIMNKLHRCANYKERPFINEQIETCLIENNTLILKGMPGIGKTQVAINYIHDSSYEEVLWLSTEKASIKILFHTTDKIVINDKTLLEKAIADKPETSLIFIEIPFLTDTDYQYLKEYFYNKRIRILIATCQVNFNNVDNYIPCLEIGALSKTELYDLFCTILGGNTDNPFFTEEEFSALLDIIDSNTLVVIMLSKMLKQYMKNKKGTSEKLEKLHHDLLDPQMWIWNSAPNVKINNPTYTKTKSNNSFFYYVYGLLRKFNIPYDSNIAEIALWTRNEIPVQALKAWCNESIPESIQQANEYGLIEYTDINRQYIIIRPFISDLIWHMVSDKTTILSYKENINKFLKYLELGKYTRFSYRILYDAASNLCFRLRQELIERTSRKFRIKDWRHYWDISRKVASFFIQAGNINEALELFTDLYTLNTANGIEFDEKNITNIPGASLLKIKAQLLNGEDIEESLKGIRKELISTEYAYWTYEWIALICVVCDMAIQALNKVIFVCITDQQKLPKNARSLYQEVYHLYNYLYTACKACENRKGKIEHNEYKNLLSCYDGILSYLAAFLFPQSIISSWNNARKSMKSLMLTCTDASLNRKARYIYSFYEAIMLIPNHSTDIKRYLESPTTLKEIISNDKLIGNLSVLENYDTKLWRIQATLILAAITKDTQDLIKIQSEMNSLYQEQLRLHDSSLAQENTDALKNMLSDLIKDTN